MILSKRFVVTFCLFLLQCFYAPFATAGIVSAELPVCVSNCLEFVDSLSENPGFLTLMGEMLNEAAIYDHCRRHKGSTFCVWWLANYETFYDNLDDFAMLYADEVCVRDCPGRRKLQGDDDESEVDETKLLKLRLDFSFDDDAPISPPSSNDISKVLKEMAGEIDGIFEELGLDGTAFPGEDRSSKKSKSNKKKKSAKKKSKSGKKGKKRPKRTGGGSGCLCIDGCCDFSQSLVEGGGVCEVIINPKETAEISCFADNLGGILPDCCTSNPPTCCCDQCQANQKRCDEYDYPCLFSGSS